MEETADLKVADLPWHDLVWGLQDRDRDCVHAWIQYEPSGEWHPACGMMESLWFRPWTEDLPDSRCTRCLDRMPALATALQEVKRLLAARFPYSTSQSDIRYAVRGMRHQPTAAFVERRLLEGLAWRALSPSGHVARWTARRELRDEFGVEWKF